MSELTNRLLANTKVKPPQAILKKEEWSVGYAQMLQDGPPISSVIRGILGDKLRLTLEMTEGQAPFIFARVSLPSVVGLPLEWFAVGVDSAVLSGLKVIMLPGSRAQIIKRFGVNPATKIGVTAIRIIRKSKSGSAMLGEVAEW